MKVLGKILIVFVAVILLLPIGDVLDDGQLNFTRLKRSIESIENADDAFLDDMSRLGLISEALSAGFTEGKKVSIEYATINEYYNQSYAWVSSNGYVVYRLRIWTDATDEMLIDYVTPFKVEDDDYYAYREYVTDIYKPIDTFLEMYNKYQNADNVLESIGGVIGMIGTGLFAIIYLLVVFLFDSMSILWNVILCFFRIIGVVPIPIT